MTQTKGKPPSRGALEFKVSFGGGGRNGLQVGGSLLERVVYRRGRGFYKQGGFA